MRPQTIERRIKRIKQELGRIGEMRPGSVSRQYNVCGVAHCRCKDSVSPKKHGPYYQLSYVHRGKSTTRFIQAGNVRAVKRQVATYRRFKKLIDDWIRLALEHAEIQLLQARSKRVG